MPLELKTDLAQYIQEECGENVYLCYQCQKCTAGCPVAEHFDLMPNQIMRAAQFGQQELILHSKTIWLCAACEACTTRCPQGIDITRIMDVLKIMAQREGIEPSVRPVTMFYQAGLRNIRLFGRMYELGLMGELYLRMLLAGELDIRQFFLKDLPLALKMIRRGKLKLLPTRPFDGPVLSKVEELRAPPSDQGLPDQPTKGVAYYPGCSLHSTAIEYDLSTRAVADRVGLDLAEPKGWACCGTTPAHSTDHLLATMMPLKNLELIKESGYSSVTMPCPSCFIRHRTAIHDVRADAGFREQVAAKMRRTPSEGIEVEHLLTTITERVGYDVVAQAVTQPLTGLKVVCYYGCVITRPPKITGAENYEYPVSMDRLVEALGAESLDWSYKTECCGVSLVFTQLPIALGMSRKILRNAKEVGAEAIVVACPLCHANLDMRQEQINEQFGEDYLIPILYFTQLMGLAFGIEPHKLGLDKHLVSAFPLLQAKRLIATS
jgi:heterodisulfide reductase subunit B